MAARSNAKPEAQLGMDEKVIEDEALEQALEKRQRAIDDIGEVRPLLKSANEIIRDRAAFHDVQPGAPVRVGRFRVSKTVVAGGSAVSFTTAERSQVNVKIIGEV